MLIDRSLKAVFNHRPDACDSVTLDLTIGCDHNCVYCHFSDYQKTSYRMVDRDYRGQTLLLSIDEILRQTDLPRKIYLSYSTDPFASKVRDTAHAVIEHILKQGSEILILTKGIIPDHTIDMMAEFGPQVNVEIGLANLDEKRRRLIEPGTASVKDRLMVLERLNRSKIAYVTSRMDPLFPLIDDSQDSLCSMMKALADVQTKNVVVSYLVASERVIRNLAAESYLTESMKLINEPTPTVAPKPVLSVPVDYKMEKIAFVRELAQQYGMAVSTCHCKDSRLKKLDPSYMCHPGYDKKGYQKNTPAA